MLSVKIKNKSSHKNSEIKGRGQSRARNEPENEQKPAPDTLHHFAATPVTSSLSSSAPVLLQPKLAISEPGDEYEREADQMADFAMRRHELSPPPALPLPNTQSGVIQRKNDAEQPEEEGANGLSMLMRKAENGAGLLATPALTVQLNASKGSGFPLPDGTRRFMEQAYQADFSSVRIHTDARAVAMNRGIRARAFTHGQDIYFNAGAWAPGSSEGKLLVAHELAHVVQQNRLSKPLLFRKINPASGDASKPIDVFADDAFKPASKNAPPEKPAATAAKGTAEKPETKPDPKAKGKQAEAEKQAEGKLPEPPQIDQTSTETILTSWLSGAPVEFVQNAALVPSAVSTAQQEEKSVLKDEFPKLKQPTGLPVKDEIAKQKKADAAKKQGAATSRKTAGAAPTLTPPKPATVSVKPVNQQAIPEVDGNSNQKENEEGWFSKIFSLIKSFLSSILTTDPSVTGSLGNRPKVPLVGDADPDENERVRVDSEKEVRTKQVEYDKKTTQDFGENNIFPDVKRVMMSPHVKLSGVPEMPPAPKKTLPPVDSKLAEEFNFNAKGHLDAEGLKATEKTREERAKMEEESTLERKDTDDKIARATQDTKKAQKDEQTAAKQEVEFSRKEWKAENEKIRKEFSEKADAEKTSVDTKIKTELTAADKKIEEKYTAAETDIKARKKAAEDEAARKKKEAENRPKSVWQRLKGAIKKAIAAVRKVVNAIFEGLRKLVKVIVDTVKKIAFAIIELARTVVVGLIKGFGAALKGFVTVSLAFFPGAAEKINKKIDAAVDTATQVVNDAADALKTAVGNLLDALGSALDLLLSAFQKLCNVVLDAMEFLAVGLLNILEMLSDLRGMYKKFKALIDGIERVWNDPSIITNYVRDYIQSNYIANVPDEVDNQLGKYAAQAGKSLKKHLLGIGRHLKPIFTHLANNWWSEIKKTAWYMIWPFAEGSPLWEDGAKLGSLIPQIWRDVNAGNYSKAIDGGLEWFQALNNTIGAFSGWITIGSVLIGAIAGAFFGGVGAIPGALAGLEVAAAVGEGLLMVMIATEAGIITKAIYDLFDTEDEGGDGAAIQKQKTGEDPGGTRVLLMHIPSSRADKFHSQKSDSNAPPEPDTENASDPANPVSDETEQPEASTDAPETTQEATGTEEEDDFIPQYNSGNVETGHDRVEYAYARIAASGFALAIMAVFALLGAIGGKIAQALTKVGKALGKVAQKVAPKLTKTVTSSFKRAKSAFLKAGHKNYGPIKRSPKAKAKIQQARAKRKLTQSKEKARVKAANQKKVQQKQPQQKPPEPHKAADLPETKAPATDVTQKPAETGTPKGQDPHSTKSETVQKTSETTEAGVQEKPIETTEAGIQEKPGDTTEVSVQEKPEAKAQTEGKKQKGKGDQNTKEPATKKKSKKEPAEQKTAKQEEQPVKQETDEPDLKAQDKSPEEKAEIEKKQTKKQEENDDKKVKQEEKKAKNEEERARKKAEREEKKIKDQEERARKKAEREEKKMKDQEERARKKAERDEKKAKRQQEEARKKALEEEAKAKKQEAEMKAAADREAAKAKARTRLEELKKEKAKLEKIQRDISERRTKANQEWEAANKEAGELWDQWLKEEDPDLRTKLNEKHNDALRRRKAAIETLEGLPSDVLEEIRALEREIKLTEIRAEPETHRATLPCFPGDTEIWTDAGKIPIERIQVGTRIYSFDFHKNQITECIVTQLHKNHTYHFYEFTAGEHRIKATGDHPFWIEAKQQWIAARDLSIGMCLSLIDRNSLLIEKINLIKTEHQSDSFNLSIQPIPNYYIGPGVLVHNSGPGIDLKLGGDQIIYRGTNPKYPGKVYIGRTNEKLGAEGRQGQHNKEAVKKLKELKALEKTQGALTPEQEKERKFWEFKKDMKLEEIIRGIDETQAIYLEQQNIDLERSLAEHESQVVNRREEVSRPERKAEIEESIREKLKAAGKECPP